MSRYVVMTATAKMPSSCWGNYRKAAIVRLADGFEGMPAMISERARGVAEVVEVRDRLHNGKTDRCEYARVLRELNERCAHLNAETTQEA